MKIIANVISDRGSKYAVAGGPVRTRGQADAFLRDLKGNKKFARATHNSWGVLLADGDRIFPIKSDDGEAGAGMVILRMLERENLTNHIVVVTRWYGGTKLGGDMFRQGSSFTSLPPPELSRAVIPPRGQQEGLDQCARLQDRGGEGNPLGKYRSD